ncbi:MAG: YeeE/YedE family protein [Hyphomicrobium sp.]|nr:YeeE/YedE family protein [Hyphomicrobium sp.]PPC81344.1 MAG: hypothetical protein CTY40_07260 [Hyphomicrobium sp.]
MASLRATLSADPTLSLAIGGLLIGFVFGAITYRTNFCVMGALSDVVNLGDRRRLRAWMLSIAVAIAGAQTLDWLGIVELSKSMYLSPTLNWTGHILGGLMFGYGMVLTGGCVSRNLVRAGSGDLRSLLTLSVLGLFAYMAIGGVLGPLRATIEQSTAISLAPIKAATQSLGDVLAGLLGKSPDGINLLLAGSIASALAIYSLGDGDFRSAPMHVSAGIGVGLCVVAAWALTGLAFDEFSAKPAAPISLTYVRPTGDTLDWLMRYTALGLPGFGVATVFGALAGAFVTSLAMGRFRLTTFADAADTRRNLAGAALMGVGGVLALGCTVGQAITGVSTLAAGSFLTIAGLVAGGLAALKALENRLMAEA